MKHLKTYENITPLYKRYIVTDFGPYHNEESIESRYYMFRVLPKSTKDMLYYDTYYYKDKRDKKLITAEDDNYYQNYKNKIFDIIYQSDSLEDAKDFLTAILDVNKYNL